MRSGLVYQVVTEPPTPELQSIFAKLPENARKIFLQKREKLLKATARVLNSGRLAFGMGSFAVGKVTQVFSRSEAAPAVLGPLGHSNVQALLNAIDNEIWSHANVVSQSKEFGFMLGANINGGAAFGNRGLYGALGFGMSIGFNSETERLVFDIYQESQKLVRALPVVAQVSSGFQAMGYSSISGRELHGAGRFITPPGPIATYDSAELFTFGLNQGIGFPPLDTFYAYENKFYRNSLLRISVSPMQPMSVHVESVLFSNPEIYAFLNPKHWPGYAVNACALAYSKVAALAARITGSAPSLAP